MRILYHHRIGSLDGGEVVHIRELTSALRNLGHEVIAVGHLTIDNPCSNEESGGLRMLRRLLPRVLYELFEFSYSLIAYRRLVAAYHRYRPDVLYERSNLFFPVGVWLKRRHGLPMLLEVNAPIFHERSRSGGIALKGLARWSEEMTWRNADYILPVSHALAGFIRRAGVPEERIAVIPNAVDPERFTQSLNVAEAKQRLNLTGKTVLGFTGFLREWHELDRAIDLLAETDSREQLHLLVVGDGPERSALEQHARTRGVAHRVTFTGSIERDAVPDHIAAFDIALQPGVTPYASPLKLYEYMASGKAIAAPNTPNIREILVNGETAILFDPDAPGSFKAAVERICQDSSLRARIGNAAQGVVLEQGLTWERNARRIEALANRLIAGEKSEFVAEPS